MEPANLLPLAIAEALERGSTVVTGNQRAARTLRLAFDRQSRASGLTSWHPPEVYAWDTWTRNLWRQLLLGGHANRLLLNRSQELQVWSSIIGADEKLSSLQTRVSLAEMAADAWKLLCQYRGQQRLRSIGVSGDTRTFQRWAQAFVRRCQTDEYLPQAELEEALKGTAETFASGSERAGGIFLTGFDRLAPAQITFVEALRNTGVEVEEHFADETARQTYLSASGDLNSELSQAAMWVRQFLESHPQAQVAVIVPDLEAERGNIERTFRGILAPELQDITASTALRPFEFSLGRSLAQAPMVAVAMELARWIAEPLALPNISRVLLSPYFAGNSAEQAIRAEFDASELRRLKLLQPELSLDSLYTFAARSPSASRLGGLLSQLRAMRREASHLLPASDAASKQKPWSEWAENIRQILEAAGWTSGHQLDSVEFQTREKWERALDELATLDFEGTRAIYPGALTALEGILKRTLFAPESRGASVQIMSPQEAAGSRFDAVYFLRASDVAWPSRPGMNPLLGWRLQRDLGMPGSNAAADHVHARRITARLAASAETIVFSYAKDTAEGRQRPSPLLNEFHLETIEQLPQCASEPVELDAIQEDFVPLMNSTVHGGADVLKQQAACGFRAFAEKRLWSTELRTRDPGMDAGERGEVVHKALEHFWGEVRTSAALQAMTADGLRGKINAAIEHGLSHLSARDEGGGTWDDAYRESQRRRLRRLLSKWLEIELDRPPFEVELCEEEFENVPVGPLLLKIRVDRVDRTDADKEIVLDYKTSAATPSDWAGDRPDEPQLPLYTILREPGDVAGVAFARLRPGKDMELNGFATSKGILPKTGKMSMPTLESQIDDWKVVLAALAEKFAAGEANVNPKEYPLTCKHCAQLTFCRLDPATLREEYDEDEPVPWDDDV